LNTQDFRFAVYDLYNKFCGIICHFDLAKFLQSAEKSIKLFPPFQRKFLKMKINFKSLVASVVFASVVLASCGTQSESQSVSDIEANNQRGNAQDTKAVWPAAYYVLVVLSTGVTIGKMIGDYKTCMAERRRVIAEHPQYASDLACRNRSFTETTPPRRRSNAR
jgi:hypothetical protein